MRVWRFIGGVGAGLLVTAGIFVGVVTTVGRGYCTEKWVPRYFSFKTECLRRSQSPRFVIMSGSNAQNTIDCEKLAKVLDRDVVCGGLIFTIPLRFYKPMLEDILQPGDVLYLPLEIWHYRMPYESLTSPFSVSFLWGVYPRALGTFSPGELLKLYARKGLPWLQLVLPKRLAGEIESLDPLEQYRFVEQYSGTPTVGGFRLRGDNVNNPETSMDPASILHIPPVFSDEFRRSFARIRKMAERRGARVLLGNVACYSYPREPGLPHFEEMQRGLGLPVCGNPVALCLPYCCFTDYNMHCNDVGHRLFTHEITKEICRKLEKPFEEREGWPLVLFKPDALSRLQFAQATGCTGRPTFGEFILDRKDSPTTNVVARVLVNGKSVRFRENVHSAKNMLWVWWNSSEKNVSVEIVPRRGCDCRAERVLMEPDPSSEIAKIKMVNDVSADFVEKGAGRFVCRAKNSTEAHLLVRIPNWKSNRYRLHLALRGGECLKKVKVGGLPECRRDLSPDEINEGKICVHIALNESTAFVDRDGTAVAGICFPAGLLNGGEEILVEKLEFELL